MKFYNFEKQKKKLDKKLHIKIISHKLTERNLKHLKDEYIEQNKWLEYINDYIYDDYPPRYFKNKGCIELLEYLLDDKN